MKIKRIPTDRRKDRPLPPVLPGPAIETAYRNTLDKLIKAMFKSVSYWVEAAYKHNEPLVVELAEDELPANELQRQMKILKSRWEKRFNGVAEDLAKYFAKAAYRRSEAQLKSILRKGGLSVQFDITRAQTDLMAATVHENVALIKSIPQHALLQVEGAVMRSVQAGRDLAPLAKFINHQYGVTKRRAALIARDQNNKATGAMTRERQLELGLEEAIWQHSAAGKEPRPTHVKMNGKKFKIAKGMWDAAEGRYVHPGELINCRCTARPIVPGFGA